MEGKKLGLTPRPPLHRSRSSDDQESFEELKDLQKGNKSKSETDLSYEGTDDEKNSEVSHDTADHIDDSEDEEESEIDTAPEVPKKLPCVEKSDLKKSLQDFFQLYKTCFGLFTFVFIVITAVGVNQLFEAPHKQFDLDSIKQTFPTQDDSLWIDFESGVLDVVSQNRPSTFILLYKEDAEETLKDLLSQLSKFATCNITDCEKQAIELTDHELNSPKVTNNYGVLIEEYGDKLRENGVMIIKNLEGVRGTSAQAFHTFCDEYTPLVARSLFIFTMKVEDFPNSSNVMKFVEDFLRSRWTDIKADIFNALITRITSMVIVIRA